MATNQIQLDLFTQEEWQQLFDDFLPLDSDSSLVPIQDQDCNMDQNMNMRGSLEDQKFWSRGTTVCCDQRPESEYFQKFPDTIRIHLF